MTRSPVETVYRKVRLRIDIGSDRSTRSPIAAETVLGSVDRLEPNAAAIQDGIDDGFQRRRNAALIGDDADVAIAKIAPSAAQEDVVAESDIGRRQRLGRC